MKVPKSIMNKFSGIQACLIILMGLSITFLLSSCDNSIQYEENQHINDASWKANDTLFFTFDIKDTLTAYDFGFNVRNTTSYSYQNLYLFITAYYPNGSWSRDTAECLLAAPDGQWLGKGNGKIRDSQYIFRKSVHFRRAGKYTVAVNQAMRTETLKGISDVGIRIVKSGN